VDCYLIDTGWELALIVDSTVGSLELALVLLVLVGLTVKLTGSEEVSVSHDGGIRQDSYGTRPRIESRDGSFQESCRVATGS
jgi:hypothetical protein